MAKFKVILMSLALLAVSISAVSAVGITDYNAPIGFERDPVTFTYGNFEMEMKWYSDFIDYDDYFKNGGNREVKMINGTYAQYFDSFKEKVGALELVKIDGEEYVVDCSFNDLDKSKVDDCLKYIEEFNEMNKFKPIKIKHEGF